MLFTRSRPTSKSLPMPLYWLQELCGSRGPRGLLVAGVVLLARVVLVAGVVLVSGAPGLYWLQVPQGCTGCRCPGVVLVAGVVLVPGATGFVLVAGVH